MRTKLSKVVALAMTVALMAVLATSAFAAPAYQADKDIVDIAIEDGRFTTLVTALQEAELVDTLKGEGPFTVFAPTDDAFAKLPEGTLEGLLADKEALTNVLLYHVVAGKVMAADVVALDSAPTVQGQSANITVDGDTVMVDNAQVIITDIEGTNGVIHVIDTVIIPPAEEAMEQEMAKDIVDIAIEDGRFTTLVTALQEAELVDTLKGEGPFTVFAPTDDAFAKLPEGTLEGLLADKEALTNVLLYHVVAGKVMAADVVALDSAPTVQGQSANITVDGNIVKVDDAQVIITDIEGSNGVIHVIDTVITPPAEEAPAALPATGGEIPAATSRLLILIGLGALLVLAGAAVRYRPIKLK